LKNKTVCWVSSRTSKQKRSLVLRESLFFSRFSLRKRKDLAMLYAREEKEFRKTTRERNHADGCAPFATMEVSTPSLFAPSSSSFSPSLFSYHLDRAARQAKGHRPHRTLAGPVDERVYFRHDELRGGGVRAVRGGGGDRAAIDETRRGDGGRRHGGSRGGGGARERRRGGPQRRRGGRREQRQGCPRGRSHSFREGERGRGRRKKRKTPLRAATICVSMVFFPPSLFRSCSLLTNETSTEPPEGRGSILRRHQMRSVRSQCSWPRGGGRRPLPLRPRSLRPRCRRSCCLRSRCHFHSR
jgi:hypothetical protein